MNQSIRRNVSKGSPAHVIAEDVKMLQFHVVTVMDNTLPGIPRTRIGPSGNLIKTMISRQASKFGQIEIKKWEKIINGLDKETVYS